MYFAVIIVLYFSMHLYLSQNNRPKTRIPVKKPSNGNDEEDVMSNTTSTGQCDIQYTYKTTPDFETKAEFLNIQASTPTMNASRIILGAKIGGKCSKTKSVVTSR